MEPKDSILDTLFNIKNESSLHKNMNRLKKTYGSKT